MTVIDACEEDITLVGNIVRKALSNNPILVHDQDVVVKALNLPPNEMLLARYWAAKEMADTISASFHKLDEKYQYVFIVDQKHLNNLVQILKRE